MGKRSGCLKGLGWVPKLKFRHAVGNSSSTSVERELVHVREVNEELKTCLEVVEEESNWKQEESIRLIETQT